MPKMLAPSLAQDAYPSLAHGEGIEVLMRALDLIPMLPMLISRLPRGPDSDDVHIHTHIHIHIHIHTPAVLTVMTFKGPVSEAKEEAKKWRSLGRAVVSTLKVQSYFKGMQTFAAKMDGKAQAKGYHERWVTMLAALPDAALETLARSASMGPRGCEAVVMMQRLGGKISHLR